MKNLSKLVLLLFAAIIMSCGGDKKENEEVRLGEYESSDTPVTTTTETEETSEVAEVQLEANDQMRFNKNEIRVKAGQTVKLTLKHTGEMPKNAMGHNFVLLKKGTDVAEFGSAAASASDNDYIPQNGDQVIANTPMLGGGEEATIEFEAPEKGTYTFICSFPGHYALMQGQFIVE